MREQKRMLAADDARAVARYNSSNCGVTRRKAAVDSTRPFAHSRPPARDFEHSSNLLRENPLARLALAPLRIVNALAAVHRAQPAQHLLFAIGEMLLEPALHERLHRPRQAQDHIAGKLRASPPARLEDCGHFVIGDAGMIGATITPIGMPASRNCAIASKRA